MKNRIILIFIFFLVCATTNAQKNIDTQFNSWWNIGANVKFAEKLSVHYLYSWRRNNFAKYWQQSLARIGLKYQLNDKFTITPGYDWVVTFPYGKQAISVNTIEHRIFEQFTLKNKLGFINVTHRYRVEQRFLEKASLNSDNIKVVDGYNYRNRMRYRLSLKIPILTKLKGGRELFLSVFDEIFVNLGKGIANNSLDQNWFNTSLGWSFNKDFKLLLGYQNQFIIKGDGINMERNHTFSFAIKYNLDLRK